MATRVKDRGSARSSLLSLLLGCFLALGLSAPSRAATLTGTIRNDQNGNGVLDAQDLPLPNVIVQLRTGATRGFVLQQTTTDVNGGFSFTNIGAGTYRIVQIPAQGVLALDAFPGAGGVVVSATTLRFVLNGSEFITGNTFLDRANTVVSPTVGSISGSVFRDTNGNNVIDGADVPLSGVTIELTDQLGTFINSTVTDLAGNYSFTNLALGFYRVTEFNPPNTVDVAAFGGVNGIPLDANDIQVTVQAGVNSSGNNFLDRASVVSPTGGSVSGLVARDLNGNNVIDGADVALAGVTVQLVTLLGDVVGTATTGLNGAYAFADVPPGFYRVIESVPPGYLSVAAFAGTGSVQNANTIQVTVFSGLNSGGNNFLDRLIVGPTTGSISGGVFRDTNGNNLIDFGEAVIPGVTVRLLNQFGNILLQTTTTGANGAFSFSGLAPGSYRVQQQVPAGYVSIGAFPGSNNAFALDAQTFQVNVLAGANSGDNNFLDRLTAVSPTVGSISGGVFLDVNGNSLVDGADAPEAGVIVQLFTLTNVLTRQTTTGVNGAYSFTDVPPGFYRVVQSDPFGVVSVGSFSASGTPVDANTIQVTVTAGFDSGTNNFLDRAMVPPAGLNTISGFVIRDLNLNGIPDNEPGLAGAVVVIRNSGGAPLASIVTDITGAFSFSGLAGGTYTVTATPPAGLFNTNAIAGQGGVRLNAASISVTTGFGTTSYPGQLLLAGP